MNGDQEVTNLLDKVGELERRVAAQDNELNCLKSSYNALLHRVENLESSRRTVATLTVKTRESGKKANSADPGRASVGPASPRNVTGSHASPPIPSSAPTSARGGAKQQKAKPKNDSVSKELVTYHKDEGIVKLWLRGRALNFYVATDVANAYNPRTPAELSEQKLKLEWVFGYRGKDARTNVHYLPTGEIAYFAASVVVLYNAVEQSQRHYVGHTDDVKCIAVHPDKITIATGQVTGHAKTAGKAHVRIWNSVNLSTLHVLGLGNFDRAVSSLAFSKMDGGTYLAVVDEGNEHTVSVWEWPKARCVAEAKSTTEQVCAIDFHPQDATCIVQIGRVGVLFWNFENGALSRKQGVFEKHDRPKCILALAFSETGDLVTGDSSGNLFCWLRGQNRITQASSSAHDGGVFAITLMRDGHLVTAGRDRRIVRWDSSLQRAGEALIDEQFGAIRTLNQGAANSVLVGTARNFILQGTIGGDFRVLVSGHTDEVWGLAAHPTQHQFVSCSYDKSVTLIDALTHQALWTKEISDSAHSAAFHPNGEVLVVGTRTGRWIALDALTRELIGVHSDGAEQIECLEFSADGTKLALGSRDNTIYLYSVTENGRKYTRVGRCSGHSSFVTHLDWSADGQFLQSNSGDYELLYWTVANCKQVVTPSQLRDAKWLTANCTLQFDSLGIWPDGADGTDVNGCSRANKLPLLAAADDFGKVRLFRYPAIQARAANQEYGGHSSHVTAVRFLCDDSRLLSAGGKDCAVIQWEVIS